MSYDRVNQSSKRSVWLVSGTITLALLVYSQLVAYFGNEPFHLLAAQLINSGKRPYLDFFYQHPPLFVYLTAAWMSVFGENWRSVHFLSALLTGGSLFVVVTRVQSHCAGTSIQRQVVVIAAILFGLNFFIIVYGTVGLAFALCLFLITAAYHLTVLSIQGNLVLRCFIAGLAAGASVASLFLTAPIPAVLLGWMVWYYKGSARRKAVISFAAGAAIPFIPLILLALSAPRTVFFDLVEYHLFHRAGADGNMLRWNAREIVGWFGSIQGLVLTGLSVIGLTLVNQRSSVNSVNKERRAEVLLCGFLSVALSVFISLPRPTFSFYYLLITPFVTILAAAGLRIISGSPSFSTRRVALAVALVGLYIVGLMSETYKMRREIFHADHKLIEQIAALVNQVTPENGWILAFEHIYFEAKREPPPGLENGFNPFSRADDWLETNQFDTVSLMTNDPRVQALDLFGRFANNKTFTNGNISVTVFWNRIASPTEPP